MCIGGCCIINDFTIVVVIPCTKVNCTAACCDAVHLGIYVTVDCYVFTNGADEHTCVTVSIVLIVCANVVINVHYCGNVAVCELNATVCGFICGSLTTCGVVLTYDTTASNVIRAPKCAYFVGVINCDIFEGCLQVCFFSIPTYATNDTTVTDVINSWVTVEDCDVFKCSTVRVSCDNTCCCVFTVGREVANSEVFNCTAINLAEQAHTVAVVLESSIVIVVVALHFPSVVVEVCNCVTVTVECTAEVVETCGNCYACLFVLSVATAITDGVEDDVGVIVCFIVTEVDVCDKSYCFAGEGVLCLTVHLANDCAKARKLLCVCDVKLCCVCIVPRIVACAVPSIYCV